MAIFRKIKSSVWIRINCGLSAIIVLLLALHNYNQTSEKKLIDVPQKGFSGCCIFPCQNGGVCSSEGNTYICDCADTNYYGKHCEYTTWTEKLKQWYYSHTNDQYFISDRVPLFWKFVNGFSAVQSMFNLKLYATKKNLADTHYKWTINEDYLTTDSYRNKSLFPRTLPPVPKRCPTPIGFAGPFQLPDVNRLYERILKRSHFKPCPLGTNLLFGVYIQHFISQFSMQDWLFSDQMEWIDNTLDMSHVYGKDQDVRLALRSLKNGKLKTVFHDGEEYPPFLKDCPVLISHLKKKAFKEKTKRSYIDPKWATGNPALGLNPFSFIMSTIWIREHNRICDVLLKEHSKWTDEQLYQTARLILTGEAIKITLTEFLQHFTQYQLKIIYEPTLTHNLQIQYLGNVPQEFILLPHWHTFLPDQLVVENKKYNIEDLAFTQSKIISEHSLETVVHAMSYHSAGEMTYNNIGPAAEFHIKQLIEQNRQARIQSYNNYRRKFKLKPAESFEELTGDLYLASILKELYFDIEAVELVVGLLVEKKDVNVIPPSMMTMAGSWFIKALISHPINSPDWWKQSTFGGNVGMNIIKSATLKKLFCLNMRNRCKNIYVDFKIPREFNTYINNFT